MEYLNIKLGESGKLINHLSNEQLFEPKDRLQPPADQIINQMKLINLSLDKVLLMSKTENHMDINNECAKIIFDYVKYLDEIDDTFLKVIWMLIPYENKKKNNYIERSLKDHKIQEYHDFKNITSPSDDFIRKLSNIIKHESPRITFMSLENHNKKKVFGFYISDIIDDNEFSGPNSKVHEPWKGMQTAFSYNHFLLRTAGILALKLYFLNKILFKNATSKCRKADSTIYQFFDKLTKIKYEFFPDENYKKYAKINTNIDNITIIYEKIIGHSNGHFDIKQSSIQYSFKMNTSNGGSREKLLYWPPSRNTPLL